MAIEEKPTGKNGDVHHDVKLKPSPDKVEASADLGFSHKVDIGKIAKISFDVTGKTKLTGEQHTKDGVTTYSLTDDLSITVKGGGSLKAASAEVAHTNGAKATYQVSLPEAAAKQIDLTSINPYQPEHMPKGAKVSLDGAVYANTDYKAAFRNMAVQTRVGDEQGLGVSIEKIDDHKVRVLAGPKEAVSAYNGVGAEMSSARAMLGRSDKLSQETLKTAEFDLSTETGRWGYNDFLIKGQIPSFNGPGISGVSTTEKLSYESKAQLELKVASHGGSLDGAKNTGDRTVTTYPDGTRETDVNLKYEGSVPLTIHSKFDKDGHELPQERRYDYTVKTDAMQALHGRMDGVPPSTAKPGSTVTVSYTEAQMQALMQNGQAAAKVTNGVVGLDLAGHSDARGMQFANDPKEFAINMARHVPSNDWAFTQRLQSISTWAGAKDQAHPGVPTQLPGSVGPVKEPAGPEHHAAAVAPKIELTRPLNDPSHPGHAMYQQGLDAVFKLDAQNGRKSDLQSHQFAASLAVAAKSAGLERIDHLVLSDDRSRAYAVQGELNSVFKRHAVVDTAQAVCTPVEHSANTWAKATQDFAQNARPSAQTQGDQAQQQQATSPRVP